MDRRRYKPGDEPIPGYTLEKWLGSGAFGDVWQARGPGVDVAIKIVRDLRRNVGGKELQALKSLRAAGSHSNLISLHGYWCLDSSGVEIPLDSVDLGSQIAKTLTVTPESLIIAMDLAECNLQDLLTTYPSGVPIRDLAVYMRDAARGIDFLNKDHRIQHCDIKPQNIFLKSGAAQIGDFGLAKLVDDIRASNVAESPGYSAPEIATRRGQSSNSDQYSLAISYYELRTGRLPYEEETVEAVRSAKESGQLQLAGISNAERIVIQRATQLDPDARFDSCLSFVEALEEAITGLSRSSNAAALDFSTDQTEELPHGSEDSAATSDVAVTRPMSSTDTKPAPRRSQPIGERPRKLGRFYLWAGMLAVLVVLSIGIAIYNSLQPSAKERIYEFLEKGQHASARQLLEENYNADTDDLIRDNWRDDIVDGLRNHIADRPSARTGTETEQLQKIKDEIASYSVYYADDGKELRALFDEKADAICKEIPIQLSRALEGMQSDPAKSKEIAEDWISIGEAFEDQPAVRMQIWQLRLISLWVDARSDESDWALVSSRLANLEAEGRDNQFLDEPGPLVETLNRIVKLQELGSQIFGDDQSALDGMMSELGVDDDEALFQPGNPWSPGEAEKTRLASLRKSLAIAMLTKLEGKYVQAEHYLPYYEFLEPRLAGNPELVIGKARLNIVGGKLDVAKRLLESLPSSSSDAVSTELNLITLLDKQDLIEFEKQFKAALAIPDPVREALRHGAIDVTLESIRSSQAEAYSDASMKYLELAERLTADIKDPADLARFHTHIDSIKDVMLSALRDKITKTISGGQRNPDFAEVMRLCSSAKVDESDSPLLKYIRTECEIETGVGAVSPLPVAALAGPHASYGTYVRAIVAAKSDLAKAAQLAEQLLGDGSQQQVLLASARRHRISQILVQSAIELAADVRGMSISERILSGAYTEPNAKTALNRFQKAQVLRGNQADPVSLEAEILLAAAAWKVDKPIATTQTRDLLQRAVLADSPHKDHLVYSFGRAVAEDDKAEAAELVAEPFANLVLAIPPEESPPAFDSQLVEPGMKLLKTLPARGPFANAALLAFARVSVLGHDLTTAKSFLRRAQDKSKDAKTELQMIECCEKYQLADLDKHLLAATSTPKRVADTLRWCAVRDTLAHIRAGEDRLGPKELIKQLSLARKLSDGLMSVIDRDQFRSEIDKELVDYVESMRRDLAKSIDADQPDFDSLIQLCNLARIDAADSDLLKYIRTECELETGAASITPLPAKDLAGNLQMYGLYAKAILAEKNANLKESSSLAIQLSEVKDSRSIGAHRRARVGAILARSASALATSIANDAPVIQQVTTPPFGASDAPVALSRLQKAKDFGHALKTSDSILLAGAAWQSNNKDLAAQETIDLLDKKLLRQAPNRGYLINALGRHAIESKSPRLAGHAVGPFVDLVLSLTPGPANYSTQFVDPGAQLIAILRDNQSLFNKAPRPPSEWLDFARLCVLKRDMPLAKKCLEKADKLPAANVELGLIALAENRDLEALGEQLAANDAIPRRVADALRWSAVDAALRHVRESKSAPNSKQTTEQLALAGKLAEGLSSADDRKYFRSEIDRITRDRLEIYRENLIRDTMKDDVDFASIAKQCRLAQIDAAKDDLLKYIRTESDIETNAGKISQLPANPLAAQFEVYGIYVRSLAAQKSGDFGEAGKLAIRVASTQDNGYRFLGTYRLAKIGAMLAQSAVSLDKTKQGQPVLERLNAKPYGELAKTAIARFKKSLEFEHQLSAEETAHYAVAAWEMGDAETAGRMTLRLLEEKSLDTSAHRDFMLYRLAKHVASAKQDDPVWANQSRLVAAPYAQLVTSITQRTPATEFFVKFVDPGLKLCSTLKPDELSKNERALAAALFALGGDLIHDNPKARWPFEEPIQKQLEFYDAAIRHRADVAEYFYGRGVARITLDDNVDRALADAQSAVRLDKTLAKGHWLLGKSRLAKARTMEIAKRPAECKRSIAAYDEARKLGAKTTLVLEGRGQAYLELANYFYMLDQKNAKQVEINLKAAKADAEAVLQMLVGSESKQSVVYAHERLGNILEDFAWLFPVSAERTKYYELAINEFTRAIDVADTDELKSNPLYHRGRCYTKLARRYAETARGLEENDIEQEAELLKGEAESLVHAISDLEKVTQGKSSKAIYSYQLGLARKQARSPLTSGDSDKAKQAFLDAATKGKQQNWPDYYMAIRELATLQAEEGNWKEADTTFREALHAAGHDQKHCESVRNLWCFYCMKNREAMNSERVVSLTLLLSTPATRSQVAIQQEQAFRDRVSNYGIERAEDLSSNTKNYRSSIELLKNVEALAFSKHWKARACYERGEVEMRIKTQSAYQKALAAFSKAIEHDPDNSNVADWHYTRGVALRLLGRTPEAKNEFQRADTISKQPEKVINPKFRQQLDAWIAAGKLK